jgi:tetratricopeptide (TPR) repeat protein
MLRNPGVEEAREAFWPARGRRATKRFGRTSRPKRRRLLLLLALTACLAASTAGLLWLTTADSLEGVLLAEEPFRRIEARVTHPLADRHRPYLSSPSAAPRASLETLARLEEREDTRALAAAHLLRAHWTQARSILAQPLGADDQSDLAVVALQEKAFNEALTLLESALEQTPRHPQARWNRALVLRELGLSHLAEEAFEEAARLDEPGWSQEAREEARRLNTAFTRRQQAWAALDKALKTPEGLEELLARPELAKEVPGTARVVFYKAIRSRTTPDQVLALLPLARVLDEHQGDSALEKHVRQVAARDFRQRGPLAEGYALLIQGEHLDPRAFLEQARKGGERDIYLGALIYLEAVSDHLDDFQSLVEASEDPWVQMLAARELAQHASSDDAEELLTSAFTGCDVQRLAYRCLSLAKALTDHYIRLSRLAEARGLANKSLLLARSAGERPFERVFLQELSDIATLLHQHALARAYLRESFEMDPEQCLFFHQNMVDLAMLDFDMAKAQEHMARALACGQPLSRRGVYFLTELARFDASPVRAEHLQRTLAELRRDADGPARLAWLLFIEGQFEIERDRTRGQKLLRQAITLAEDVQTPEPEAFEARSQSFSTLIIDAGQAGEDQELLKLVAEDRRIPVPGPCTVIVEDDHTRVLTAVRGADGKVRLHFDGRRSSPLGSGRGVIPQAHLEALQDCQQVRVLASPSVLGSTELLPPELPWSYQVGHTVRTSRLPGKRLVIHNVEPSQELKLPPLPPRTVPRQAPGLVELERDNATPRRVLAEMTEATSIEIHAHGLERPGLFDAPFIALTPDNEGRHALTASEIRRHRLNRAPVVFLAACSIARRNSLSHQPSFGLPMAFIDAGASAVLAATVDVPNSAGDFFVEVGDSIRAGTPPAVALATRRAQWLRGRPQEVWVKHVLLYE